MLATVSLLTPVVKYPLRFVLSGSVFRIQKAATVSVFLTMGFSFDGERGHGNRLGTRDWVPGVSFQVPDSGPGDRDTGLGIRGSGLGARS